MLYVHFTILFYSRMNSLLFLNLQWEDTFIITFINHVRGIIPLTWFIWNEKWKKGFARMYRTPQSLSISISILIHKKKVLLINWRVSNTLLLPFLNLSDYWTTELPDMRTDRKLEDRKWVEAKMCRVPKEPTRQETDI